MLVFKDNESARDYMVCCGYSVIEETKTHLLMSNKRNSSVKIKNGVVDFFTTEDDNNANTRINDTNAVVTDK